MKDWEQKARELLCGQFNISTHHGSTLLSDDEIEALISDKGLDLWIKRNFRPNVPIVRASVYKKVSWWHQEIFDPLHPPRDSTFIGLTIFPSSDPRRPVFMRGSVGVMTYMTESRHINRNRGDVLLNRYLKKIKYTSTSKEKHHDFVKKFINKIQEKWGYRGYFDVRLNQDGDWYRYKDGERVLVNRQLSLHKPIVPHKPPASISHNKKVRKAHDLKTKYRIRENKTSHLNMTEKAIIDAIKELGLIKPEELQ
jgi:hypothetical protein